VLLLLPPRRGLAGPLCLGSACWPGHTEWLPKSKVAPRCQESPRAQLTETRAQLTRGAVAIVGVGTLLVLPLSLQPTLTSLRYFTFAGLSSMLFTTAVVVHELAAGGSARYRPPAEQLQPGTGAGVDHGTWKR
jgi:hypothetical protein